MNLSHPFAPTIPPLADNALIGAHKLPHPSLPWTDTEHGRKLLTDAENQLIARFGPGTSRMFMGEARHAFYMLYLQFALQLRHAPKYANFMPRIIAFSNMNRDALAALQDLHAQQRIKLILYRPDSNGRVGLERLRNLITANTVLVTLSVLAPNGQQIPAPVLDGICGEALARFKTPVHADLTLADAAIGSGAVLDSYPGVQCFSNDLSYSCLLDGHFIFIREQLLSGYRLELPWRENHIAALMYRRHCQYQAVLSTLPATGPVQLLEECRRNGLKIITYDQFLQGGHGRALVTINNIGDETAANWPSNFLALALTNEQPIDSGLIQRTLAEHCQSYVHCVDMLDIFADSHPLLKHVLLLTSFPLKLAGILAAIH